MADAQNMYELTYILNAVLNEEQTKSLVQRVNNFISNNGGEVLEVDEMGSRRLAYPIKKRRNGYYVNMYFRAPGDIVGRLERAMEIEDDVLRYLTLRMDSKHQHHYEQQKQRAASAPATEAES